MFSLLPKCWTMPKSRALTIWWCKPGICHALCHILTKWYMLTTGCFCPPIFYVILDGPCSQWMNGPVLVRNTGPYLWKHANQPTRILGHATAICCCPVWSLHVPRWMNMTCLWKTQNEYAQWILLQHANNVRIVPGPVRKWSKRPPPRCSSKQVSQCPIATAQNGTKPCILYT